jgi:hypothetical protein
MEDDRHAFFTTTAKLVLGLAGENYLSDEQQREFWDRVAFYNYVQDFAGETPSGDVTPEMWEDARAPFLTVVNELEPDAVLILGKGLSEHVPASDIEAETCVVTHPSAPGFTYDGNQEAVRSMLEKL